METISEEYRKLLTQYHEERSDWGTSGSSFCSALIEVIEKIGAESVLDYGCGKGGLGVQVKGIMPNIIWHDYDVAIHGKDIPVVCDLVTCTDVMEHVEEEYVDAVLKHIEELSVKGVFMNIACQPAAAILPDGRNAHITQKSIEWWQEKIEQHITGKKDYTANRHRRRNRRVLETDAGNDVSLIAVITK